jgi:hypothetical protein
MSSQLNGFLGFIDFLGALFESFIRKIKRVRKL